MIKRLIFDVDGTLIPGVDFTLAISQTLRNLNLYSTENLRKLKHGIDTYEELFNNYNEKDFTSYMSKVLEYELPSNFYSILGKEEEKVILDKNEKLIGTLNELSKKYEMVLLTNYFRKTQVNRLNNMGIGKFFSKCYGEERIKPNYEAFINSCGNNRPNECVMIGDDIELDIKGAKKAGLNTIFVNSKNVKDIKVNTITVKKVEDINIELIEKI
ncbi:MAG: HAD family hydrolase [Clostridia bacterium]|nr:HAD family hydrolase [Clostridia bacterium]